MTTKETTTKPMAELLQEMEALVVDRLREVEEKNRRLRLILAGTSFLMLLMIAGAGAILYASMRAGILGTSAESISAREFVLADAEGNVRGAWTLADDGAARFYLHDANGVARVKLAVVEGGAPGLSLTDAAGRSRVVLGFLPDETSTLVFADQSGEARAVLGLSHDDARIIFADREGAIRAGIGVAANGDANLILDEGLAASPSTTSN